MAFSPPYFWSGHLETETLGGTGESRSPGLENRATPEGTVPGIPQHKLKEEAEGVVGLGRVGRAAMQKSRHLALGAQLEQLVPLLCNGTGTGDIRVWQFLLPRDF